MENETILVGVYPALEPFGKKIRGALKQAGVQWVCLRDLTDISKPPALFIINGAALGSDDDLLKAVLQTKARSSLHCIPTILLDAPEKDPIRGWAEGYEARLSLRLPTSQIAQIIQRMLSQLQPTLT